jgi:hypothetical protein
MNTDNIAQTAPSLRDGLPIKSRRGMSMSPDLKVWVVEKNGSIKAASAQAALQSTLTRAWFRRARGGIKKGGAEA